MATKKRKRSESGFYHVFQRGVCLFDIFEDDEDRKFYLKRLVRYASELHVEIHAWCLMSNHTHLLVRAQHETLSAVMRKIGSVYARYFNKRHGRTGPLFEDRFGSVCVETDSQFLSVMRYIHRNPIHHEERTLMGDYPWSSYGEYMTGVSETCEQTLAMSIFGSVDRFISFHHIEQDYKQSIERYLDIDTIGPMRDDEARLRANHVLVEAGIPVTVARLGALPYKQRDMAIALVKHSIHCSLRQLQRLTAIAFSAIRNAVQLSFGDVVGARRSESAEASVLQPGRFLSSWHPSPMNTCKLFASKQRAG